MIIKKILLFAASIINLFILINIISTNSNAEDSNSKRYSGDKGVLAIMYHRFNESKYPSTNIQMDVFQKHIDLIKEFKFNFYNPNEFEENFDKPKETKRILLTIDDAFSSFYNEAWPILKK